MLCEIMTIQRPIREDRPHALEEKLPLVLAVKVVDHQETAAQQMLAHPARLRIAERPGADLDGVEPRVIEQVVGVRAHNVAVRVHVDARQPLDRLREVVLGAGIVGGPAAASTEAAAIREPHERPLLRLAGQWLVGSGREAAKATLRECDRGQRAEQHNQGDQAHSSLHAPLRRHRGQRGW